MTMAKGKDGGGNADFNMDSVIDASGNIYATSQANGKRASTSNSIRNHSPLPLRLKLRHPKN